MVTGRVPAGAIGTGRWNLRDGMVTHRAMMLRSEIEGRLHTFPGVRRDYDKSSKSSKSSTLVLLLEEQHAAVHDLHWVLKSLLLFLARNEVVVARMVEV